MTTVLQLTKKLVERPVPPAVDGVSLRHYRGPADIGPWLELRGRAFSREKVGIGQWDAGDFKREFLDKPWWNSGSMWLAEASLLLMPPELAGTITLARRGEAPEGKPVVHWLAVLPRYRRRGIGRLLVSTLEATVWDEGLRQVWLETHREWKEARQLYEALGYQPA